MDHFDLTKSQTVGLTTGGGKGEGHKAPVVSSASASGLFAAPTDFQHYTIKPTAQGVGGRSSLASRAAGGGLAAVSALGEQHQQQHQQQYPGTGVPTSRGVRGESGAPSAQGGRRGVSSGGQGGAGFVREFLPSMVAVKAALGFEASEAKTKELDDLAARFSGGSRGGTSHGHASRPTTEGGGGGGVGGSALTLAAQLKEVSGLRTEDDAVAFFLRHGPESLIKFIFLVRSAPLNDIAAPFRPYNLNVVSEEAAKKAGEYFVMSSRGLVLHSGGGAPGEFLPLSEFLREASAFSNISALPFFKFYLRRKTFNQWAASVRFNRFARARAATAASLFAWFPTFSPALAEVASQVALLQTIPVFLIKPGERFNTRSLSDTQREVQLEAGNKWEKCLAAIIGTLERLAGGVQARASVRDELGGSLGGEKHKSMALVKAEKEAKAQALRVALGEQALLGKVIRRVDYMVTCTLVMACEGALGSLLKEIRDGENRVGASLFATSITFLTSGGTGFSPSLEEYLSAIDSLARETRKLLSLVTRVLHAPPLRPYLQTLGGVGGVLNAPSAGELLEDTLVASVVGVPRGGVWEGGGWWPGAITDTPPPPKPSSSSSLPFPTSPTTPPSPITLEVRLGASFKALFAEVEARVRRDFGEAASSFALNFDAVRPIFDYSLTFNWEEFKAQGHDTSELQGEMIKLRAWREQVGKMVARGSKGCLEIDARKLKEVLAPITEVGLDRIKTLVLDSVRTSCKSVSTRFLRFTGMLDKRPTSLDKFAQFLEFRGQLKEQEPGLNREKAAVEDMFNMAKAFDVKISSEDAGAFSDLITASQAYAESSSSAAAFADEKLPDMCRQLDTNILRNNDSLKVLGESVSTGMFIEPSQPCEVVLEELKAVNAKMASQKSLAETFSRWQVLFGQVTEVPKEHPRVIATQKVVDARTTLWKGLHNWDTKYTQWTTLPFSQVDTEELSREVQASTKQSYGLDKSIGDGVTALYKSKVQGFRGYVGVVVDLGNHAMRERHWARLYAEFQQPPLAPDAPERTLGDLLAFRVYDNPELCAEVSGIASGELQLENTLAKIEDAWGTTNYSTKNYREQRGVYVLSALDDITTQLEDHQVTLQTMLGSRFIAGVREGVELWDKRLALLSETQDEWLTCQRGWMYLETIFSAEDIQRQLPVEAQRFALVDRKWKEIMAKTHARPLVIAAVEGGDELLKTFKACNESLEAIQKALEEYLETKRSAFPRFYFLSNDELLAILAQTRDPRSVQPHMQKCFDAILKLQFDKAPHPEDANEVIDVITCMESPEGESVRLLTPVPTLGNVEDWLTAFEDMMRVSLKDWSRQMWERYPAPSDAAERKDWYFTGPAQCILGVDIIRWTENCTKAIASAVAGGTDAVGALTDFFDFSMRQLQNMVTLVRGDLSNNQRILLGALTTIDVHARDTVTNMIKKKVASLDDFEWTKQLRYYWEEDVIVRQCNTRFNSGHEYLGNSDRLVITPLTDQCYMTLTGALHLKFGGAPAGPAGTGKTETTKDLAKALCVQCVVFNCSDGLDYKIMGRFFSGLAQAGCWACFDEFNRIDIEVLSVIAQQVLTIQQGLQGGHKEVMFEGRMMPLKPSFGVFITMNPGYAGRSDLPDNLKSLFRPVAMMVPDYRLIAEIILFSKGFGDALLLSNKMVNLYKLASEQLSKQDHYDFGMRAVKSVLVAAGQLKRKEPTVREDVLLIRAMRDSNVPKFLAHDLPLFRGIINDLFPGVDVPLVDYGALQKAVELQLTLAGLQIVPSLVEKIIQTHETQLVRHGMMLVGESGSGKTVNHVTLSLALKQLYDAGVTDRDGYFKEVIEYVLNPKSIAMGELYGEFNLATQEWRDGLVAILVRQGVADTTPARKWVLFDGPVDAIWIENMNTVLDDNKMLCLANGERIKLPSSMHMIFEVRDLAVASPATVSRCGMVFCEPQHVGNQALVDTWRQDAIMDLLPDYAQTLRDRISEDIPKILRFLRRDCSEIIASQDGNLVASFLNLLLALLRPENGVRPPGPLVYPKTAAQRAKEAQAAGEGGDAAAAAAAAKGVEGGGGAGASPVEGAGAPTLPPPAAGGAAGEEDFGDFGEGGKKKSGGLSKEALDRAVDLAYVFALTWSFGANIHDTSRTKFNSFAQSLLSGILELHKAFLPAYGEALDLYTVYFDPDSVAMEPWSKKMSQFTYTANMPFFSILVPSIDTTRYAHVFQLIVGSGRNVLFAGDTGVGKSVIVADALAKMTAGEFPKFASANVNFSAQTSSGNLQEALEANLEKKRKNLLGAPSGKRMCVFVDDLNMPAKEKYGAQPPIELLRQVIDQGGMYDRGKVLFFKSVADTVFAAACAPPGGGRQDVTTRLTRRFHMVWLPALSVDSMVTIFQAILGGFLGVEVPTLASAASDIVAASVSLYQKVGSEMLPTPSKSHYTFNLRDLSKVFQGVLLARKGELPSLDALVRLWLHEEQRVFRDRLTSDEDRGLFNTMCSAALTKYLGLTWELKAFEEVIWGDFTNTRGDSERPYKEVDPATINLPALLTNAQEEYNLEGKPMSLTFFNYAIAHVSRISRILRQPRGNALLVGVGGSGRQSLTRLAAFLADMKTISIEITRGYGKVEWQEDLVKILMVAGAKQKDVVFLFSDTQIVKESMLEDVNNILNSGDVPNLYPPDVMEQIINAVRPIAKAAGRPDTRSQIFAEYIMQVREHLHIVLAMSPIGTAFRNRCRMFPALVNCCTIDWFSAWPQDALFAVARSFMSDGDASGGGQHGGGGGGGGGGDKAGGGGMQLGELVDPLCKLAVAIHQSVETSSIKYLQEQKRYNYTTPTSYLELLRLYQAKLQQQRSLVTSKLARYKNGLTKLAETNAMVEGLQAKLKDLQPVLEKAKVDTAELLTRLEVDQKDADAAAALAAKDEAATAEVAAAVAVIKDDCQKDLDEALPAYFAAMKALKSLDKKSIGEVKSFAKPPPMVAYVLEAVCILLNKDTDWDSAKALMGDSKFMDMLLNYDKDNIDPKLIKKLVKYIKNPDFVPEVVAKTSVAAVALCSFCRAIYKYYEVATTIAPKKAKLAEAEGKLAEADALLSVKRAELAAIQAKLAELKATFNASLAKREELNKSSQQTTARLGRAHQLTGGLGDEAVRWTYAASQLEKDLSNLIGNMLLAAGCIAYLGPFTASYRTEMTGGWIGVCQGLSIPVDPSFDLLRLLADPTTVREWNIQGLPTDTFSAENGLFATMGRRWPLMIDPQGQANRWTRNMYRNSKLQLIKQTDPTFLRTLENGVRYGFPVLLENVEEELDPALEPLLLKQYQKKGGQVLLRLGDTDVPVSEEFRFLITTKLANPHYLPEVCIKVTIINFTVTMSGLIDQLLGAVVSKERPDLEVKRDQLVVTTAADKRALKDIEDKILQMLADSKGDILDDEDLISSLAQSKVTSTQIGDRMRDAEATGHEISTARESYRPVAARGATLYFSIASLSTIDNMYQFSLPAFTRLYTLRIEKSEKAEHLPTRIANLLDDITRSFYAAVCRGLFEVHKLLYAFIMASDMLRVGGGITAPEWTFFMLAQPLKSGREAPPSAKGWLSQRQWLTLLALEECNPVFKGIADDVGGNVGGEWGRWVAHKQPTTVPLPGGGKWAIAGVAGGGDPPGASSSTPAPTEEGGAAPTPAKGVLSPFQWLLVLRALRDEKVVLGVREFVRLQLGGYFTEPPPFDLEGPYGDSTASAPLIFILSPGADPVDYLFKLAKSKGKAGGLKIISLGQGQGPLAIALMDKARASGDWVCLQNCHLSVSWLPKLEAYLENTAGGGGGDHPDYRLWLTSSPTPAFPSAILQNGVKLTMEPPRGMKAQLRQVFIDLPAKEWEGSAKPSEFKPLLFALSFFHAVVLERRKFGPIGWNIGGIDFMSSDLKTAQKNLVLYLEEQAKVPWETLNNVTGDVCYGGRLTDKWDKRCSRSILARYLCPPVLEAQKSYFFDDGGLYYPPTGGDTLETVRAYIEGLPQDEPMDVFGLHENASISLQLKETGELLDTLVSIQPRSGGGGGGGGGGKTSDELVAELADDILKRLPPNMDLENAHPVTFALSEGTGDGVNSLGVFLQQEIIRFNNVTNVMRSSLSTLKKALKGLVVMSSALEVMAGAMLFQRVPPGWEAVAYPSLKPLGTWVSDLIERLATLDKWLRTGPPSSFWISGFFFPQGFTTGALQMYARKTRIPIDTLEFRTLVQEAESASGITEPPPDGVYVHGLFVVCARWNKEKKVLDEMEPGRLLYRLPVVLLDPVLSKDYVLDMATGSPDGLTYPCPFYKTSKRAGVLSTTGHSTNFVMTMGIPSDKPVDHWVRRGTAILSEDELGATEG